MSLPALPRDWNKSESFKAVTSFTTPEKLAAEPVGPGFLGHARRILRNRTFSEDDRLEAERNVKAIETADDDYESEPEDADMLRHDPKDWKSLDQYEVLGLTKYRWRADEDLIRKAHRRKVLKHHPDKKAAEGAGDEDGFFKCIQKAFETLIDPSKRRQWDSVDPKANVPVPSKKTKGDFFERWGKFFEAESRFSTKQPVPQLGDLNSTKAEVDAFYSFWRRFDSWRSFEWLDEDVPDDSSNRDNKRYIEKKNKALRAKHKKDDTARLIKAIDLALSEDPRHRMFKDAEKAAKAQKKWEREAGSREAAEKKAAEEQAKADAEAKAKADAEANKDAKEAAKKAKEAAKSAKKKHKRTLRNAIKDVNYLLPEGEQPSPDTVANALADVDNLIEALDDMELADYAGKLSPLTADSVKAAFTEGVQSKGIKPKFFL